MYSPLEQFLVVPIFGYNFVLTNEGIILILILFLSSLLLGTLGHEDKKNSLYIVLGNWQYYLQKTYSFIIFTLTKNINNTRGQQFFPLIYSIFIGILFLNLFGLIPNSFCLTSHLIVTFGLSLSIFIGVTTICIIRHKWHFFSLFLPANTPFVLALLLIPIELISYFFKPLSLSIRLFANMMAGHALMHVIAGFGFTFLKCRTGAYFVQYIPVVIIFALFFLDIAVCTIQAFVFTILICIYLNDAINLH